MKNRILPLVFIFTVFSARAQNLSALNFDGSSGVDCGNASSLNITGTALTVEAWIRPTSFTTNYWEGSIVAKDEGSATGYVLRCGGSGRLSFVVAVTGNTWIEVLSGTNVLSLNQWQHVAGVYDGTNLMLYVNGLLVASVSENRSMIGSASLHVQLGQSPTAWVPSRNFIGSIDEARIWNVARTAAQVRISMFKHVSSGTGLAASYQMSDASGTTLTDNSGGGNTGSIPAGVTWVSSPIQYKGNALSFDGGNDNVQIGHMASQDITSAITLEAWVYATKSSGIQNVISKSSSSQNNGYIFPRTDDGWTTAAFYLNIGGWRVLTATFPSLNAWHHLAATYDGTNMKVYVDGTLSSTLAMTGAISTNTNDLVLGNQPGYSEYFGGYADEFRVWNVARTQAQIQASMNTGVDPTSATGLVSYFTMDQCIPAGTNTNINFVTDLTGTKNGVLNNFTLTGATSNFVTQNATVASLPLKWVSFDARAENADVMLRWVTSAEVLTKNFVVQHSMDGNDWTDIGDVPSSVTMHYAFTHFKPGPGKHLYRLHQVDMDGKDSYSKTCAVDMNGGNGLLRLFPNPVTEGAFNVEVARPVSLSLYDVNGRVVRKLFLNPGLQRVNTSDLPSGVYQWVLGRSEAAGKIVVKH